MPKPSSRERILDSYEDILTERGPLEITLDAVAAHAGVSKGGLLYHFGSKDALRDGLLDRLTQRTAEDIDNARKAPEGVVRYFLRTAITDATPEYPLHRTTMATLRLALNDPRAAESLQLGTTAYRSLINEHVASRVEAELILLVGDGLYMRSALGEGDKDGLLAQANEIADHYHLS